MHSTQSPVSLGHCAGACQLEQVQLAGLRGDIILWEEMCRPCLYNVRHGLLSSNSATQAPCLPCSWNGPHPHPRPLESCSAAAFLCGYKLDCMPSRPRCLCALASFYTSVWLRPGSYAAACPHHNHEQADGCNQEPRKLLALVSHAQADSYQEVVQLHVLTSITSKQMDATRNPKSCLP